MSLFKRNKTWWTDFSVNGVRYRQSLDTTDWRQAQAMEKELIADATKGKLAPASKKFARLAFNEAADRYLETRSLELSDRSYQKERQLLVEPRRFFASAALMRIGAEELLAYRQERAQRRVGATYLNMEMGAIRRILKRAQRWHLLADEIRPLRERHQLGRALSEGEKDRLINLADTKPEWFNVRLAQVIALNTTMRGCEIKGLRWKDIDLIERTLTIRRSSTKTDAGERAIPLNEVAYAAILELYRRSKDRTERAKEKAETRVEPTHYLFPACENSKFDPTRPQTSWRTAWRRLTRTIHCPACGQQQDPGKACQNQKCKADIRGVMSPTAGLRFHDLRHHAVTELAESQASDQTIMAIAGHVSPKMLAHYSHVRMEAKRKALDGLAARAKGYGTNSDTNALQVNEMVGPNGLEPSTSSVSGRRSNQLSYGPITNGATFPTQAIRPQNSNHSQVPDLHRVKVAL
jgi:integrase